VSGPRYQPLAVSSLADLRTTSKRGCLGLRSEYKEFSVEIPTEVTRNVDAVEADVCNATVEKETISIWNFRWKLVYSWV